MNFKMRYRGVRGCPPRRGGCGRHSESLAAKRTFVGQRPRPCERAEQAEQWLERGGYLPHHNYFFKAERNSLRRASFGLSKISSGVPSSLT